MHLLISHAAPTGSQCQAALAQLALPRLTELLGLLTPLAPLGGSPGTLTPLVERVRANALGLEGADGLIPWAATDAQQLGLTKTSGLTGWAWVTPCNWRPQSNHVSMGHPEDLQLTPLECDALRTSVQPYFNEDGIALHPLASGAWLAQGAVFKDLPTASLERVAGASVDAWLPRQPQAKPLRKLQSEMQMLLHTHPVNDDRARRNAPTINAFWVSGTGTPQAAPRPPDIPLRHDDSLKTPTRQDHVAHWTTAWHALDGGAIAEALQRAKNNKPVRLTLCGERQAMTWELLQQQAWWNRLQNRMTSSAPQQLLGTL